MLSLGTRSATHFCAALSAILLVSGGIGCTRPVNGYFVQGDKASLELNDVGSGGGTPVTGNPPPVNKVPSAAPSSVPSSAPSSAPSDVPDTTTSTDCLDSEVKVTAAYKCHGDASAPVFDAMHCNFKLDVEGRELKLVKHHICAKYHSSDKTDGPLCAKVEKDSVLSKLENLPAVGGQYHIRGVLHACVPELLVNRGNRLRAADENKRKDNVRAEIAGIFLRILALKDGAASGPESARKGRVETLLSSLSGDPAKAGYCVLEHREGDDDEVGDVDDDDGEGDDK
jgi:hypothetical protein